MSVKLKRRFDEIHNPPFQPTSCPNVYFMKPEEGPETKKFKVNHHDWQSKENDRNRTHDPFNFSQVQSHQQQHYLEFNSNSSNQPILPKESKTNQSVSMEKESPFMPSPGFVVDDKIFSWIPMKRRNKYLSSAPKEKIFSKKDLSYIIQKAVEDTQREIKVEYDRVLRERLSEQYDSFTNYVKDYLHQQYSNTNHTDSYTS